MFLDATLLLSTSQTEALPLAPLEAAACGRPVVACNVGGMGEAVLHGRTGLLAPPDAPEQLVAHIGHLFSRPDEGIRMGNNGRRHVLEHFTAECCLERFEQVYKGLLCAGDERC